MSGGPRAYAPEPILDPGVIESLRQLTPPGEPDVLAEILQLFLQEVPRRIDALRTACAAGNAADVHQAAHSLKGSAGTVGAKALHRVCRQLDELGTAGDVSTAKPLVDALDVEFARVEMAIRALGV